MIMAMKDALLSDGSLQARPDINKTYKQTSKQKKKLMHRFQGRLHESIMSDNLSCTLLLNDVVSLGNRASCT